MWGICVDVHTVILSSTASKCARTARPSIGEAQWRFITNRPFTTTSASLKADSVSPFLIVEVSMMLSPHSSWTRGDPFSIAFSGSTTAGSGS